MSRGSAPLLQVIRGDRPPPAAPHDPLHQAHFAYRPGRLIPPFNCLSPFSSISISYQLYSWSFLRPLPAELFDYGDDHMIIDMIAGEETGGG